MAVQCEEPEWDEVRCKEALGRLEQLQEQLNCLRPCVPHILDLLRNPQPSPQHLVNAYKDTAIGASRKLTAFKIAWESPDTKKIIGKAQKSFENNRDLTPGYQIPHYGWAEALEKVQATEIKNTQEEARSTIADEPEADVATTLKQFSEKNPRIRIDAEANNEVLKLRVPFDLSILKLTVTKQANADGTTTLEGQCRETGSFSSAVNRCIAARPAKNNLRNLLNMIAAYQNSGYNPCTHCSKIVDDNGLKPAARRLKPSKSAGENNEPDWESWHESCLL